MVAAHLPVTREVVEGLVQGLAPLGLLSIYADRQLEYFLKESSPFIGAPQAREAFGVTGKGVGVGVLDSGIDGLHQDFDPRVNLGRNVKLVGSVLESPLGGVLWMDLPNTDTTSGHGTHVASTIAGLGRGSCKDLCVRVAGLPLTRTSTLVLLQKLLWWEWELGMLSSFSTPSRDLTSF
ncbi:S8 family serine peptidase [Thermus thermamylovorans]|uniref:S8 family serine peptidase n=1 Tax=Thermus thermamylovorans TaxID=2509362 RepID=UPI003D318671